MINENEYNNKVRPEDMDSWDKFSKFLNDKFSTKKESSNNKLYLGDYVWRGQRYVIDGLISSFDREFKIDEHNFVYNPGRDIILNRHLNSFAYAVRSRLKEFGLTVREIRAAIQNEFLIENHIWALGQHYGLKTPLLDWCYSPYVAAYFAFKEKPDDKAQSKNEDKQKFRIIWGLNYKQVCDNYTETGIFGTGIDYFDPMSSEHPRLINQRGLFTITKDKKAIKNATITDIDIEEIIKNNEFANCSGSWLIKIRITDTKENREEFLRSLNSMNINHMSLFPEIEGSAEFCNIGLEFNEYARFHGQGGYKEQ